MSKLEATYESNVFINCPFDREYAPLFDAIVFTITDCRFRPVCARERMNSAQFRLEKIVEFIQVSRYSVHDISRTEIGAYSLPRFNMPLELGIALGCVKYGSERDRQKSVLVLDRKTSRYHRLVSDLSGQDISAHHREPLRAIEAVRNWLQAESGLEDIPGAHYISRRYQAFRRDLPSLARQMHRQPSRLTFVDYCDLIQLWLERNARAARHAM